MSQFKEKHDMARDRFKADPSKCYQRHIRELYSELEPRGPIDSLTGARVIPISNEIASSIILKYEWLRSMASGTKWCCGLFLKDELLGAACFNLGFSSEALNICGQNNAKKAICLARGACVPRAPKNSASFLIRHACRLAYQVQKWEIFFAYSDVDAGEIGTVYQASNWYYLGQGVGRTGRSQSSGHTDFVSKDGQSKLTSYAINGIRGDALLESMGWKKGMNKRKWLRDKGWDQVLSRDKHKWVWFEGPEKEMLKNSCRYSLNLPYPKRNKTHNQSLLFP